MESGGARTGAGEVVGGDRQPGEFAGAGQIRRAVPSPACCRRLKCFEGMNPLYQVDPLPVKTRYAQPFSS